MFSARVQICKFQRLYHVSGSSNRQCVRCRVQLLQAINVAPPHHRTRAFKITHSDQIIKSKRDFFFKRKLGDIFKLLSLIVSDTDLELSFHFSPRFSRETHAVSPFFSPASSRLQQPNIKQKFVALLKRFKVTDEVGPVFSRVFLTCSTGTGLCAFAAVSLKRACI